MRGQPPADANSISSPASAAAESWLRLSLARGIGPRTGRRLVEHFHGIEALMRAPERALRQVDGLGPRLMQALHRAVTDGEGPAAILSDCSEHGIRVLCPDDEAWPQALNGVDDAPLVLFARGDVACLNHRPLLSVVGARRASPEGRKLTRNWCRRFSEAGVGIVSGMAWGIDAAAHRGALEGPSPTLAVLGCGLAALTEEQQRQVAAVERQGCVISEFLPRLCARPEHFPRRNRIIAALGAATLVMEADLRSGSLITARLAAEYGREVLAVPGSVLAENHGGCHLLIREGAQLVENVDQVLQTLGLEGTARCRKQRKKAYRPASPAEAAILEALGGQALHVDVLAETCGLTLPELSPILLALELQGVVERLPGSRYMLAVELQNQ